MTRRRNPSQQRLLRPDALAAAFAAIMLGAAILLGGARPAFAQTAGWLDEMLKSQAVWVWFVAAFVGGLFLNLTPCVFPMVPVTVAFFSGQAAGRTTTTLRLGALYVAGIAFSYALLGLLASQTGALLGSWLQQPAVLVAIALVMVALALSMFGLYELQPPAWVLQRFGTASSGGAGALVMGLTVGVIAAPCVGPVMLGLLLFVGQLARPVLGFWLLFTMGVGMGLPYLVLGLMAQGTTRRLKGGPWLVWVKKLLGIMLLGLGLHFLRPLLGDHLTRWVWVLGMAGAGAYLGWIERGSTGGAEGGTASGPWLRAARWATGTALVLGSIAVASMPRAGGGTGPSVGWVPYSPERLAQAAADGTPAIIDVYADWCIPCVELDHTTFRNPAVIERLQSYAALRIDATQDVPANAQALLDRYGINGVPTVLLIDRRGAEHPDLRIAGFVTPKEFLERLDKLEQ